jgi:hypothetical protein
MRTPTVKRSGPLHAVMREVEPGMFRAEYPGEMNNDSAQVEAFPDRHIGTSAAEVKNWVEEMAAGMGYERVVWHADDEGPRAAR